MVSATFTGNSLVVTFKENPDNKAELQYIVEYECANRTVVHVIDQADNIDVDSSDDMRVYRDTLLYEDHKAAGLTRNPTIKLYTVDSNNVRSGALTVNASNPPPPAPSFQSEVSHNLIIMNFYPGTDSDFVGYHVWASETTPVAKIPDNEKAFGPNPIISFKVEPSTTYYVRYSGYDAFGEDGAIENEVAITTPLDPSQSLFEQLDEELTEAQGQLADLVETYGDTASASASALAAQEAKDDALAAASAADGHASVASTKRDEAVGAMTTSQASALSAQAAVNKLIPSQISRWEDFIVHTGGSFGAPVEQSPSPDWGTNKTVSGEGEVREFVSNRWIFTTRGKLPKGTDRTYKVTARFRTTTDASPHGIYLGFFLYNEDDSYNTTAGWSYRGQSNSADGWTEISATIESSQFSSPYIRGGMAVNSTTGAGSSGGTIEVSQLRFEDITESAKSANSAIIANAAAVAASDSESSATSQANLSASFAKDAFRATTAKMVDSSHFCLNPGPVIGEEIAATPAVGAGGAPCLSLSSQNYLTTFNLVPLAAGRTYRFHVDCDTIDVNVAVAVYPRLYVETGGNVGAPKFGVFTATNTRQMKTVDITYTAAEIGNATQLRPAVKNNQGSGWLRIYGFWVEDITESDSAAASADIATSQATTATAKAAAAAASEALTASYAQSANQAAIQMLPSTFENDGTFFAEGYSGPPTRTPASGSGVYSFVNVSGVGRVAQTSSTSATRDIAPLGAVPLRPGRKYQARCVHRTTSGTRSFTSYIVFLNDVYTYTTVATSASATSTTGWQSTGAGGIIDGDTAIAAGHAYIRPLARFNAGSSVGQVSEILIEDITESQAASTQAGIATSQAAVATAQAAAAQQSATLSANLSSQGFFGNSAFADWTGTYPAGYINWSGSYTLAGKNDSSSRYGSPNILRITGATTGTSSCGLYATQPISSYRQPFSSNQWVVIEVDARLNAGELRGAGILFRVGDSSTQSATLDLYTDPDTSGTTGNGSSANIRSWRKLVQMSGTYSNSNTVMRQYIMNNWSGFPSSNSGAAARTIDWYYVNVRPATDGEIKSQEIDGLSATVTSQASVLATHTTQLASRLERVTAGPSSATLKMTALNSSGGAASQIALQADEIKMGTSGGGLTINGGKATFTGELNVGNDTGARVKITSNLIEVYNASGVRQIRLGIW